MARASKSPRASAKRKPFPAGSKSAFIIAQPANLGAQEVVERAKANGITTTTQAVHVTRTVARKRGLLPAVTNGKANGHSARPKPDGRIAKRRVKQPVEGPGGGYRGWANEMRAKLDETAPVAATEAERALLAAALQVGLVRASRLISALQTVIDESIDQVAGTVRP